MFTFTQQRTVKAWPATIIVAENGGTVSRHPITVDLELIDAEQYRKLAALGDVAVISAIVKGWEAIGDEQGQPLPFTAENRDALAKHVGFANAVLTAYMQAARGEAAEKN